jgi:hypothetical protein
MSSGRPIGLMKSKKYKKFTLCRFIVLCGGLDALLEFGSLA